MVTFIALTVNVLILFNILFFFVLILFFLSLNTFSFIITFLFVFFIVFVGVGDGFIVSVVTAVTCLILDVVFLLCGRYVLVKVLGFVRMHRRIGVAFGFLCNLFNKSGPGT